jgi:hypothetical protein
MATQFEAGLPIIRTSLDLLAGAVDAWLHPEWTSEIDDEGDIETMITASRCQALDISRAEALQGAAWMIGLSLLLSAVGIVLDKMLGDSIMTNALLYSAFFIAFTVSSIRTYLKPYSRAARNVIVISASIGWYVFFLAVAAIAGMI